MIVLSKYFRKIRYKNIFFIYHSLFGNSLIIKDDVIKFLESFANKGNRNLLEFSSKKWLEYYKKKYFLVEKGYDERTVLDHLRKKRIRELANKFNVSNLGFVITDYCNFQCKYCVKNIIANSRIIPKKTLRWTVAKKAIDIFNQKVHTLKDISEVYIGFSGGEPLINFELLKKITEYSYKKISPNKKINFTLNTNSSLVNNEIAEFLSDYQFTVSTSLDGCEKGNDLVRKYLKGGGTFQDIKAGIKILNRYLKKGNLTVYTTIIKENFGYLNKNFIDLLKELGIKEVTFEPDIINCPHIDVDKLINFLYNTYCEGKKRGIVVNGYWKKPYLNLYKSIKEDVPLGFCEALRGRSVALCTDNSLHVCGYSNVVLANLNSLNYINKFQKYLNFISNHSMGNIELCKGCGIEGQCLGGCYLTHEVGKPSVIKYRCELYLGMTKRLIKHFLKEQANRKQ